MRAPPRPASVPARLASRLPSRLLHLTLATLAACAALGLAACDDDSFSYAHIDHVSGDPNATFSLGKIDIPVGEAVIARIQLFNDDDDRLTTEILSDDSSILAVRINVDDATFTFLALKVGVTQVRVLADGSEVKTIPVTVREQPTQ